MNYLERMAGWNPNSAWYSMAKQLEKGERDMRRFEVESKAALNGFLADKHNREWVKKADGQGKDAIWYEYTFPKEQVRAYDDDIDSEDKTVYNDTTKEEWLKSLTEEEHGALQDYKSSESYKINAAIREEVINGAALSEEQKRFIARLDAALKKAPKYRGEVYRNITFDDFGGEEELNAFLAEFVEGEKINLPAFTSASTKTDGYPVKGEYTISFIIDGKSARDVDGIGDNSESEVIFERNSKFVVDKIIYDENGKPIIYMEEATQNGTGQFPDYGNTRTMQQVQKTNREDMGVQSVSERNTGRGGVQQGKVQGVSSRNGGQALSGETVTVYMTPAQKVHMYLESKCDDNLRHMAGGRTFADRELYSKGERAEAYAKGNTVRLSPEDVNKICGNLTAEEKALADALSGYYNGYSTKEINRVSNILYGYDKAMGENYAPIYTNQNYVNSEIGVFDITAEGVGNLKNRRWAKNPSYNISAFDAFEKSVERTKRFVGMAIPTKNWNTLLNWQDGTGSMKATISGAYGKQSVDYIENLLNELQGGRIKEKTAIDDFVNAALSKYISAVFGANPSIVLKQAASFPLAATYLGWGNMPNIAKAQKVSEELISKYTGELAYRLLGYATPETAQLKNNPGKLQEKGALNWIFGGGAITWMDGKTVKTIWSWAENKVRKEHPELEIGTQAEIDAGQSPFYKEVAREFEEAVSRSQPMYDIMHRSGAMRSGSTIARAFTLFKTVPQQELNMLRQSIGEARYQAKNGDKKAKKAACRKAGSALMGIITGNLLIGAISFLNALWKHRDKKYRDDDGEMTISSVLGGFAEQFINDSAGVVIFGDTLADWLGSFVTGERFNGLSSPGVEQIGDILEALQKIAKPVQQFVSDSIEVLSTGADWKQYMEEHSDIYLSAAEDTVTLLGTYIPGFPVENLRAYLLGTVKWISPKLATKYEDAFDNADKNGLKGLKGTALEARMEDILLDRTGTAEEQTVNELARLYSAGFTEAVPSALTASVTIDDEKRELNIAQQQTYKNIWKSIVGGELDNVINGGGYGKADDETREKILRAFYDYAADKAKMAVFDDYLGKSTTIKADDILKTGLDMSEYLDLKNAGATDRYLKGIERGAEPNAAYHSALATSGLDPEEGKKSISDAQRWRAAVDSSFGETGKLEALKAVMNEKQFEKLETAHKYGIEPETYVRLKEILPQFDENGNGNYSNAEIKAAIDSLDGGVYGIVLPGNGRIQQLTIEQKAILWQLYTGSKSAENNPYSAKAGRKVLGGKSGNSTWNTGW